MQHSTSPSLELEDGQGASGAQPEGEYLGGSDNTSAVTCDHRIRLLARHKTRLQYAIPGTSRGPRVSLIIRLVDYILHPRRVLFPRRVGSAVGILVIYYLLLLPVVITFARLLHTIFTNPGFVPRGPQWHLNNAERRDGGNGYHRRRRGASRRSGEKDDSKSNWSGGTSSSASSGPTGVSLPDDQPPHVEDFWRKDVFICNFDGRPSYCSTCLNFKPDRAHHCSEVDRCVRKMDHFCPWVGGIVSETGFKFFIQFCFYAALLCLHVLAVMAYYIADRRRVDSSWIDVHWTLALAFAALFLLFSGGMFASSFQLALVNVTTVENLSRHSKVWYLAVWMPRPEETIEKIEKRPGKKSIRTISYPRPPEEQEALLQRSRTDTLPAAPRQPPPMDKSVRSPIRTFAILETPPGANPWDLGPLRNAQEVMGYSFLDWLLPLKHSPCASHGDGESMFKLGPVVQEMRNAAGLVEGQDDNGSEKRPRRRQRRNDSRC